MAISELMSPIGQMRLRNAMMNFPPYHFADVLMQHAKAHEDPKHCPYCEALLWHGNELHQCADGFLRCRRCDG